MLTIARLFGKSPFSPLQTHMKRVSHCIEKLSCIFDVLPKMDLEKIEKLSKDLSELEHEADLTKNDIRNHLPKSLFLPMDRSHFLDILSIQDSIADKAEDIGVLLSFKTLEMYPEIKPYLDELYKKSIAVFSLARTVIEEMDELLESSFGGLGAEKVRALVEQTAFQEHEARQSYRKIMKQLLSLSSALPAPAFYLWIRVVEDVGAIAEHSERLANRIRMILELK